MVGIADTDGSDPEPPGALFSETRGSQPGKYAERTVGVYREVVS